MGQLYPIINDRRSPDGDTMIYQWIFSDSGFELSWTLRGTEGDAVGEISGMVAIPGTDPASMTDDEKIDLVTTSLSISEEDLQSNVTLDPSVDIRPDPPEDGVYYYDADTTAWVEIED